MPRRRASDPEPAESRRERDDAPGGLAQWDPEQQTHRRDLPPDVPNAEGKPRRGTSPSEAPDRSRQPEPHAADPAEEGLGERNTARDDRSDRQGR